MFGEVLDIAWPTPGLARVTLGGDGLAGFAPAAGGDQYVNVAIPPEGAPYAVPFDLDELKELPREQRPFRRRYTVRSWDLAQRRLTLEIVVHDPAGPGGRWVAAARPGDALVFTGPAGDWSPGADADWHLMVGDESALPAVGACLELVPEGRPVLVRLVCDGPEHEIPLHSRGELDLAWSHRTGDAEHDAALLPRAVADLALPAGRGDAFVHGEAGETREVRRLLLAERGLPRTALSCSPYWRRGMDDEAWRAVKAAWNADVARDVPDPDAGS